MTDQHRATDQQWARQRQYSADGDTGSSCILELRDRIQALELALRIQAGLLTGSEQTSLGVAPVSVLRGAVQHGADLAQSGSKLTAVSSSDRAAIVDRLRQLARAVTLGPQAVARECDMRIPAEPLRDADFVLSTAADLLSQPESQGPTDEEIDDQFFAHCYTDDFGNELMEIQQFRKSASAVLARYGRPAIEPVPITERLPGPEDCDAGGRCWAISQLGNSRWNLDTIGAGLCFYTHWLPHYALPVPVSELRGASSTSRED